MSPLFLILIVLLLLMLFGGYGYHAGYYAGPPAYGYGLSIGGVIVLVLLVLLLTGRL